MSALDAYINKGLTGAPPEGGVSNPVDEVDNTAKKTPDIAAIKQPLKQAKPVFKYTLHSHRPGLGFFIDSVNRVKFNGNYFMTDDKDVVDYVIEHYGSMGVSLVEEE